MQKNKKQRRKGPWDIYKTAICIDQYRDASFHEEDKKPQVNESFFSPSSILGKSAQIAVSFLGNNNNSNRAVGATSSVCASEIKDLEKRMEDLEKLQKDLQGSLHMSISSLAGLKKEIDFTMNGISEQIKKEHSAMESLIQGIKHTQDARIQNLESRLAAASSGGSMKASEVLLPKPSKTPATQKVAAVENNAKEKRDLSKRSDVKNSGHPPVTRSHLDPQCIVHDHPNSLRVSDSESSEEETEDDNNSSSSSTRADALEELLSSEAWNIGHHENSPISDTEDGSHCGGKKDEEEDGALPRACHAMEDPEPPLLADDGMHNTLHQVIIGLRSQTYTQHKELDVMVTELRDVADLDYPPESSMTDVPTRQAMILKLITCFYQTVCVVSMESARPCEQIYRNPELLQQVTIRVQAMV